MLVRTLTAIAVTVVVGAAPAAANENAFDPSKTKKETRNLKRAYEGCETPDTTTPGGLPVCSELCFEDNGNGPSDYQYEDKKGKPKASCVVKISQKSAKDCSKVADLGLPAVGCEYLVICLTCKGILKSDGVAPIDFSDDGWTLRFDFAAALPDGTRMPTIPLTLIASTPKDGQLNLKTTSLETMQALFGTDASILPVGSILGVENIELSDPLGRTFAK